MIKVVDGDLLKDIRPYSIILHQVNCLGIAGAGVALQIRNAFPGWYASYSEFCKFFAKNDNQPDRSKDLLGSFHKYAVNDNTLICSAFAQHGISKAGRQTDYAAWEKILRRLEHQVHAANDKNKTNWIISAPYGIGCGLGGGDWTEMMRLFEYFFKDSPVNLVIRKM